MINQPKQTKSLDLDSVVHFNNFIFLVLAYCTKTVALKNIKCDKVTDFEYLNFVFYGNLIVYGILITVTLLNKLGLLEMCSRKLGPVFVTLNTFGFVGAVFVFDLLSMIYGIYEYLQIRENMCGEIELFTMCCGIIFLVWMAIFLFSVCSFCLRRRASHTTNYQGVF